MTNIEWTDVTWNPVIGCRHVAEGCRHCYAETMSKRLAAMGQKDYASILDANGKFNGKAITRPATLAEPLKWKKPRMVFVNSMSDLFHEDVSFEFIAAVFGVMAACPQHTFQVLTKRPERALAFFERLNEMSTEILEAPDVCEDYALDHIQACHLNLPEDLAWPLKNVWLGVSIATQADADKNIPALLKCPASVRFVSAEPLIEGVDLRPWLSEASGCEHCEDESHCHRDDVPRDEQCPDNRAVFKDGAYDLDKPETCVTERVTLDWVIIGGESGGGARPCNVAWVRSIVQQCKAAGVPCFVKQLGSRAEEWNEYEKRNAPLFLTDRKGGDPVAWDTDLRVRQFPEVAHA